MRTTDLLAKYKRGKCDEPDETWKRLVWLAAKLVVSAEEERRTRRTRAVGKCETRDRQMELFDFRDTGTEVRHA